MSFMSDLVLFISALYAKGLINIRIAFLTGRYELVLIK